MCLSIAQYIIQTVWAYVNICRNKYPTISHFTPILHNMTQSHSLQSCIQCHNLMVAVFKHFRSESFQFSVKFLYLNFVLLKIVDSLPFSCIEISTTVFVCHSLGMRMGHNN